MKFLYTLVIMGAVLALAGCSVVDPVTLDTKARFDAKVSLVKFNFDKDQLKDSNPIVGDAFATLDKFVSESNAKYGADGYKVGVVGRTDYVASDEYNEKLGMRRAQSVADYLASKGVVIFLVQSAGETDDVVMEPYIVENVPGIGTRETNRSITLIILH